jgi:selenocysteine lyase/cysteine desulfurase
LVPREDFPGLAERTYLNAAGIGLIPRPVQEQVAAALAAIGDGGAHAYFERYDEIMLQPRRTAAQLLHAPVANVAIATSISEVISQVAWWRRPGATENVVVVEGDCPSTTFPWVRVARETGAEIRLVRTEDLGAEDLFERLAAQVDDATAAICVSHVQWVSGYRFDLRALGRLARRHQALLIIDAMHSLGALPVSRGEVEQADVFVAGSFKWLCGPAGAAPLYVSPALLSVFDPVMVGSRTSDPVPPFDEVDVDVLRLPPDARRFEYGSSILLPRIGFSAAAAYLMDVGLEAIGAHNQRLGELLIEGLSKLGAEIVTPRERERRAGIISACFAGANLARLQAELGKRRIDLSLRQGRTLRFAPHLFNDDDDIARALDAIGEVLRR